MQPLRQAIAGEVHRLVASRTSAGFDPRAPREDEGYFGPRSVAWRVHGDFTTMLVGGVSALLMQMLHPEALAGVWDHSDFRRNMQGRLARTAHFISGTTYGSIAQADALIARVRSIHDHVHGALPDGRTYSANDPALLTWVHIAGSWSFLQSYLRHKQKLPPADRDRYFEESAVIARLLGATDVPVTHREAEDYLQSMRPQLAVDSRTRTVARALLTQPPPRLMVEPVRRLVMSGGVGLLPGWAAHMHGFSRGASSLALDTGVSVLRNLTAWALSSGKT